MSTFLVILIPEYGQSKVPFVWAFSNWIDRPSNEMHMWNNFAAHLHRASRKKKQNFAGFSGANLRKNQPISQDFRGIFAGKKSKFVEKSANFVGFSRKKSQISQKNRPILRDFSGKKSNFEGFSGANSREISGGGEKLRQEAISKKRPNSLDFFG